MLSYKLRSEHSVVLVCDNNIEKHGVKIGNYVIKPATEIPNHKYDAIIVASMQYNIVQSICMFLAENLGISKQKIYTIINVGTEIADCMIDLRSLFVIKDCIYESSYLHITNIFKERPLDINIELINRCPLQCVFCCNRKTYRQKYIMNIQLFKKIVSEYVNIFGGGGIGLSSMQSDLFLDPFLLERLKYLQQFKPGLHIYTTNPLVSIGRYSDDELAFILQVFDLIQISVQGVTKHQYIQMVGVDLFETFYHNLRRIKKIIDSRNISVKVELCFRTNDAALLYKNSVYQEMIEMFPLNSCIDSYFDWWGKIT